MAVFPKVYTRPAAVIFSTNNDITSNGYNASTDLILTDHGRQDIQIAPERIETAGRMVDGTYRSHFVVEKNEISLAWTDVPSRRSDGASKTYTADGYAGGIEIIDYLEDKSTPFYVKFTFDNTVTNSAPLGYPEVVYRVAVKGYSYNIKQRSGKFDMMDLDVTLTEV